MIYLSTEMSSATNGSETPRRETRNHFLFEIATEVANRGWTPLLLVKDFVLFEPSLMSLFFYVQWEVSTPC